MAIVSAILVIVGIVAFVAAGWYFQYRLSGRRMWRPLWGAFSFTAAAVLFLTTGVAGYLLDKQNRFAYTGEVIWSQVTIGLGASAVATLMWIWALRRMSRASSER
jgi:hypothetical protein